MSKGDGKIIAIKFTEPLHGDVAGNETHFTISGKEYEYVGDVNGELIDTEYEVGSVERCPIQRVWKLGEELQLDGPGEMAITDSKCYETASGTTLTGTVQANACDIVLATISHRSTFTTPAGWNILYESPAIGSNQRMVFAIKKIDIAGQISFTASQSTSGRIYLNLISISGILDIESANEYELSTGESTVTSVVAPNKQEGEKLIWGASANIWITTSPYGSWEVTPNDLQLIQLPNSTQPRQLNAIDVGTAQAINREFIPNAGTGSTIVVSAVRLIKEYTTPKIHISQAVELLGSYRIRWIENKPQNTDILIECTTGETQGQWQEVNNGDIITSDTNLWFRITLETTDTRVTPTLQDLWIEPSDAPADTIRLIMNDYFRFNNVAGDLTVLYDGAGSLAGFDGPVEGFTESFTPIELAYKGDQNPQTRMSISEISATGLLTDIFYTSTQATQGNISISSITVTGTLTDVSDI